MTEAEQLAICRQRIRTLDDGIDALIDAWGEAGKKRGAAMDILKVALSVETATIEQLRAGAELLLGVLEDTAEERRLAHEKFHRETLVIDWTTAIVCSHDMTPEQREFWLSNPGGDVDTAPAEADR